LRGMSHFHKAGREDIGEALRLFLKAIDLDENFSTAYGMAAWCLVRRKLNGWADAGQEQSELEKAAQVSERAVECGKDDAIALAASGLAIGYGFHNFDRAISLFDRAQALNPNLAMAWHLSSWIRSFIGQQDVAVMHLERAARLSPVDPQRPGMQASIACAHFAARRFDLASRTATEAMLEEPNNFMASIAAAAAGAMMDNLDRARSALLRARELDPHLSIQKIKDRLPYRQPELLALWEDALRKAGLPE